MRLCSWFMVSKWLNDDIISETAWLWDFCITYPCPVLLRLFHFCPTQSTQQIHSAFPLVWVTWPEGRPHLPHVSPRVFTADADFLSWNLTTSTVSTCFYVHIWALELFFTNPDKSMTKTSDQSPKASVTSEFCRIFLPAYVASVCLISDIICVCLFLKKGWCHALECFIQLLIF